MLLGVPVGDADAFMEALLKGVGVHERTALPVGCPRDADAQGDGEPLREAVPQALPVAGSEGRAEKEAEGEGGGLRETEAERQADGDTEVLTLHDRVGSVVLLPEGKEVGEGVAHMEPVVALVPLAGAEAVPGGVAEADTLGLPLREAVSQRDAVPASRLADTLPLSVAQGRDPEGVAVSQKLALARAVIEKEPVPVEEGEGDVVAVRQRDGEGVPVLLSEKLSLGTAEGVRGEEGEGRSEGEVVAEGLPPAGLAEPLGVPVSVPKPRLAVQDALAHGDGEAPPD